MDTVTLPFPVISKLKTAESPTESGHIPQNPSSSFSTNQSEETKSQQVVILPLNILHKTDASKFIQESDGTCTVKQFKDIRQCNSEADTTLCMSTNFSGSHNCENKALVQQVPPLKDINLTDTRSLSTDICSLSKSQQCINYVHSFNYGVQTHTKNSAITSPSSSLPLPTDSKQELKTVCIRESQSILVTTRGGKTGIVKVQKSSDLPTSLSKNPVITMLPKFQAYLVPQISPLFYSHSAGQSVATVSVTTGPVQTQNHFQ